MSTLIAGALLDEIQLLDHTVAGPVYHDRKGFTSREAVQQCTWARESFARFLAHPYGESAREHLLDAAEHALCGQRMEPTPNIQQGRLSPDSHGLRQSIQLCLREPMQDLGNTDPYADLTIDRSSAGKTWQEYVELEQDTITPLWLVGSDTSIEVELDRLNTEHDFTEDLILMLVAGRDIESLQIFLRMLPADVAAPLAEFALLMGCKLGRDQLVQHLLGVGVDPNVATESGVTVLHVATMLQHPSTVQLLLDSGADVDTPSPNGYTALHLAVQGGHVDTTRILLKRQKKRFHSFMGVKVYRLLRDVSSAVVGIVRRRTIDPLLRRTVGGLIKINTMWPYQGRADVNATALNLGEFPSSRIEGGTTLDDVRLHNLAHIYRNDPYHISMISPSLTPLHLAVARQDFQSTLLLLRAGADPLIYDCQGINPLVAWFSRWCTELVLIDELWLLFLERIMDAPWIIPNDTSLEPLPKDLSISSPSHTKDCFHRHANDHEQSQLTEPLIAEEPGNWQSMVSQLCGLAGIVPERERHAWKSCAHFSNEMTSVEIDYNDNSGSDSENAIAALARARGAMSSLQSAVALSQQQGWCCDTFSFMTPDSSEDTRELLSLRRLDVTFIAEHFEALSSLHASASELHLLSTNHLRRAMESSQAVLGLFSDQQKVDSEYQELSAFVVVDMVSLTTQFLCLSFLSYVFAHASPLNLVYLDTLQDSILLCGATMGPSAGRFRIKVGSAGLACLRAMTAGPVLAFSLLRFGYDAMVPTPPGGFQLSCQMRDLIDTFGPADFITRDGNINKTVAIIIGGGYVYKSSLSSSIVDSSTSASDSEHVSAVSHAQGEPLDEDPFDDHSAQGIESASLRPVECHWSEWLEKDPGELEILMLDREVVIGSAVWTKDNCEIKHTARAQQAVTWIAGTFSPLWVTTGKEMSVQAGQYGLVQYTRARTRLPGKCVKDLYKDPADEDLVEYVEYLWGLQVSLCTGVARRVTLRRLILDLLPHFAQRAPYDERMWTELRDRHRIFEAFAKDAHDFRKWLNALQPLALQQRVLDLMRKILAKLHHSGIDRAGMFTIAWITPESSMGCIRIACENENAWLKILADSDTTATYAYIAPECLESHWIRCKLHPTLFKAGIPGIGTTIQLRCPRAKDSNGIAVSRSYYFQTFDDVVKVVATKADGSPHISLKVEEGRLHHNTTMWRRVTARIADGRLIEQSTSEGNGEQVTISSARVYTGISERPLPKGCDHRPATTSGQMRS
ncbi:Hypothetical protein D9617_19g103100 [Elsinoe fawcettii]|nr:Hypothetical protein D9617_19g103100 [Elsinoe fawcettii]